MIFGVLMGMSLRNSLPIRSAKSLAKSASKLQPVFVRMVAQCLITLAVIFQVRRESGQDGGKRK
jgi:hypothetical protein